MDTHAFKYNFICDCMYIKWVYNSYDISIIYVYVGRVGGIIYIYNISLEQNQQFHAYIPDYRQLN